jgi:hypothetical protein
MGAISASKIIYEFLAVCAALRRKFLPIFMPRTLKMRRTLIGTNEKKSRACRGWKNYLIVGTIEKTDRQRVAAMRAC